MSYRADEDRNRASFGNVERFSAGGFFLTGDGTPFGLAAEIDRLDPFGIYPQPVDQIAARPHGIRDEQPSDLGRRPFAPADHPTAQPLFSAKPQGSLQRPRVPGMMDIVDPVDSGPQAVIAIYQDARIGPTSHHAASDSSSGKIQQRSSQQIRLRGPRHNVNRNQGMPRQLSVDAITDNMHRRTLLHQVLRQGHIRLVHSTLPVEPTRHQDPRRQSLIGWRQVGHRLGACPFLRRSC